jgi:hypothetical protein
MEACIEAARHKATVNPRGSLTFEAWLKELVSGKVMEDEGEDDEKVGCWTKPWQVGANARKVGTDRRT